MTPTMKPTIGAPRVVLSAHEAAEVRGLARKLATQYASVEDPEFLRLLTVFSHELPKSLRMSLNHFKLAEPLPGWLTLSGYPIDQVKIGNTPAHWQDPSAKSSTKEEEFALVLIGSLLGDVFGWATQQGGRLVHEVFPIKGHEQEQLGSSSTELLTWHTEDAFHPCRGDYLLLMCLRNHQRVSTTVAPCSAQGLSETERAYLRESHFRIRPDESHLPKNRPVGTYSAAEVAAGYTSIQAMNERPDPIPVLLGDKDSPYVRLDPYFMEDVDANTPATAALRALIAATDRQLCDVILDAGDILCLDNFRVVHGRRPFAAAFDGSDRWLKRINITRDLRKSRAIRSSAESRVICG